MRRYLWNPFCLEGQPSPARCTEQREIGKPWSYGAGILPAHHSGDLPEVIEIVGHPRREELAQGDRTELGVTATTLEIGGCQSQRFEPGEVLVSQLTEG